MAIVEIQSMADEANAYFMEYLIPALYDALSGRDLEVVELRLGFSTSYAETLSAIGTRYGISRERVRQLVARAISRVRRKGLRQLKQGCSNEPCARLLTHLYCSILPNEEGVVDRLVGLCETSMSYVQTTTVALPVVVSFLYTQQLGKAILIDARHECKLRAQKEQLLRRDQDQKQKRHHRFSSFLKYIIWPAQIENAERIEQGRLMRLRDVNHDGRGEAGSFASEKMNRFVQYESKTEFDFMLCLEASDHVLWYQEQPLAIPYELGGEKHTYYPDLLLALSDGRYVIVEIKPIFLMPLRINLLKWSALRQYCCKKGWGILISNGRYAIQEIQAHSIDRDYAREVLSSLKSKRLFWSEYKQIASRHQISSLDFPALVLKAKLDWFLGPFTLSLPHR